MPQIDQALLAELLREKEELLARYPELRPLQKEIDRTLASAGEDPMARLKKSFELLADQMGQELGPEVDRLKSAIETAIAKPDMTKVKRSSG